MRTLFVALGLLIIVPAASRAEAQTRFDAEATLETRPIDTPTVHAPFSMRYRILSERLRTRGTWGPALLTGAGYATALGLALAGVFSGLSEFGCDEDCTDSGTHLLRAAGVAAVVGLAGTIWLVARIVARSRWRRELRAIRGGYALASPPL